MHSAAGILKGSFESMCQFYPLTSFTIFSLSNPPTPVHLMIQFIARMSFNKHFFDFDFAAYEANSCKQRSGRWFDPMRWAHQVFYSSWKGKMIPNGSWRTKTLTTDIVNPSKVIIWIRYECNRFEIPKWNRMHGATLRDWRTPNVFLTFSKESIQL